MQAMPLFNAISTLLHSPASPTIPYAGDTDEERDSNGILVSLKRVDRVYQDVVLGAKSNRMTWANKGDNGESQEYYKDQQKLRTTLFELESGK
jgi:hypothetical protein